MRLPSNPADLRELAGRHGRMTLQEAFLVVSAQGELLRREIAALRRSRVASIAEVEVDVPERTPDILAEAEATLDAAGSQEQPVPPAPEPVPSGERDPLAELDDILAGGDQPPAVDDPLA